MGWQDDPVVEETPKAAWQSDPVIGESAFKWQPDAMEAGQLGREAMDMAAKNAIPLDRANRAVMGRWVQDNGVVPAGIKFDLPARADDPLPTVGFDGSQPIRSGKSPMAGVTDRNADVALTKSKADRFENFPYLKMIVAFSPQEADRLTVAGNGPAMASDLGRRIEEAATRGTPAKYYALGKVSKDTEAIMALLPAVQKDPANAGSIDPEKVKRLMDAMYASDNLADRRAAVLAEDFRELVNAANVGKDELFGRAAGTQLVNAATSIGAMGEAIIANDPLQAQRRMASDGVDYNKPAITPGQKWAQTGGSVAGGLAAFVVEMAAARRVIGGSQFVQPGKMASAMLNIRDMAAVTGTQGGNPVEGAAVGAAFEVGGAASMLPGPAWLKAAFGIIGSGAAGAGTTKLAGGSDEETIIMALLPAAMKAPGGVAKLIRRVMPETTPEVAAKIETEIQAIPTQQEAPGSTIPAGTPVETAARPQATVGAAGAAVEPAKPMYEPTPEAKAAYDAKLEAATAQYDANPTPEGRKQYAQAIREAQAEMNTAPADPARRDLSMKNAALDAVMVEMSQNPATKREAQTVEQWHSEAEKIVAADPAAPQKLIADITANPRTLSDVENFVVLHEQNRLRLERNSLEAQADAAIKAGDYSTAEALKPAIEANRASYDLMADAAKKAGSEWGAAGRARQEWIKEDYSLSAQERAHSVAKGRSLSLKELAKLKEQTARLEELEREAKDNAPPQEYLDRIAELEKELAEGRKQQRASGGKKVTDPSSPKYGARNRLVTRESYEAMKNDPSVFTNMGADMAKLAKIVTFHIEALGRELGKVTEAIVKDFGEKARPFIKEAYGIAERAMMADKMKAKTASGKGFSIYDIRELKKSFVEGNPKITTTELIDAVHGELVKIDPAITRDQAWDLVAGYGDTKLPSMEEPNPTLRDLTQRAQLEAKLRDMAAGKAPLRSGPQRGEMSDEARRLTAEVQDAVKKGGFKVTDPETQLKSADAAKETHLRNQISDIEDQLAAHERTAKERNVAPDTPEIAKLRAHRDMLKAQLDETLPKPGKTVEQKNEQRAKQYDARIAHLQDKVARNDFSIDKKAEPLELDAANVKRQLEIERLKSAIDRGRMTIWDKVVDIAREASSTARIIAGGDASMMLLQLLPVAAHDVQNLMLLKPTHKWSTAVVQMFQAFKKQHYTEIMGDLQESPYYKRQKDAGLWVEMHGKTSTRDETFMSNLPSKIPFLGKFIDMANQAAVVAGNSARDLLYRELAPRWEAHGRLKTANDWAALATFIGDLTGRAKLPQQKALRNLLSFSSQWMFSARQTLSTFRNVVTLFHTFSLHPELRREGARQLAGFSVMAITAASIANLFGAEVELDPRSSDFMSAKVGNTRYNLIGGLKAQITFIAKFSMGEIKTSDDKMKKTDRGDVVMRYLKSRENPLLSIVSTAVTGRDGVGKPVEWPDDLPNQVRERVAFMYINDAIDSFQQSLQDNPSLIRAMGVGVMDGAISATGVSVQTYAPKPSKTKNTLRP